MENHSSLVRKFFRRVSLSFSRARLARKLGSSPLSTFFFFLFFAKLSSEHLWKFRHGGIHLFARSRDWFAVDEVLIRNEYDFVIDIVKGCSAPVVLDLGANIGLFAAEILKSCPNATVYSVEASEATFKVLKKNCQSNASLKWQSFHAAVWESNGNITFEDNPEASTGSFINQTKSKNVKTVPSVTLESLIDHWNVGSIDVAKIDIEGAEERVFRKSELVLNNIQTLIIETHPYRCDHEHVVKILRQYYPCLYQVLGRESSKPLLIASRIQIPLSARIGTY